MFTERNEFAVKQLTFATGSFHSALVGFVIDAFYAYFRVGHTQ